MSNQPTIVLVHGALTDASIWHGVSRHLWNMGYETIAPAMPLRGLYTDAEYLSTFLKTIDRPMIVVGHSYGGSVISHPAICHADIKALVFVAAFAPDVDESTGELNGRFSGSKLDETTTLMRECPGGEDLYLRSEHFGDVYAADVPAATVALMASAQRPLYAAALGETFDRAPAWMRLRSWNVIATNDQSLPPEAQRFMAERAGSTVVEVEASHALPVSQPETVAQVIDTAARETCQG
ncbi:alpha/beta hydrolase [Rhodanobacter sp. DHG33]|uniref:alpha/beta fold hydrolase n=1 Tax=Rhodanobacter sp. DHG33 TaxID=2775921 RepID=UPI001781C527|nr:alpha/beta hydrolase [Rhodanobacter sp. DHG33]MBD8900598.1 alpha/beta hydrolase [Rhodanobacter sp. DHG33]